MADLNQRVTIQTREQADPRGPITWSPIATVWAGVDFSVGKERYINSSNVTLATQSASFTMRRRDLDTAENRLDYDGREWDIVGVSPDERNHNNIIVTAETR